MSDVIVSMDRNIREMENSPYIEIETDKLKSVKQHYETMIEEAANNMYTIKVDSNNKEEFSDLL